MNVPIPAPRWTLVVGTLGICLGTVGLLGSVQDLALPYLVEIQKEAAHRIGESLQSSARPGGGAWTAAGKWLQRPDWYPAYANAMAVVRGLLGALLILASVRLVQVRTGADRLFMYAAGLSAVRNGIAVVVGIAAGSVLAVLTVAAGVLGFLLDTALLLACRLCRRDAYRSRVSAAAGDSASS